MRFSDSKRLENSFFVVSNCSMYVSIFPSQSDGLKHTRLWWQAYWILTQSKGEQTRYRHYGLVPSCIAGFARHNNMYNIYIYIHIIGIFGHTYVPIQYVHIYHRTYILYIYYIRMHVYIILLGCPKATSLGGSPSLLGCVKYQSSVTKAWYPATEQNTQGLVTTKHMTKREKEPP